MKKPFKTLTIFLTIATLSNCVGIKSDKYTAIKSEELKITSVKKSKIFINWGFYTTMIDNPAHNVIDKAKSDQKKIFTEIIKESDCCELTYEIEEADIYIDGAFYNESSKAGIYASFLSGFTFAIIPCWTNSKMRIFTKAVTRKMVKDYDIKDSVFIAIWAPLIVATPFANAITAEDEVNKNLYRTLIAQMKKDGFFNK